MGLARNHFHDFIDADLHVKRAEVLLLAHLSPCAARGMGKGAGYFYQLITPYLIHHDLAMSITDEVRTSRDLLL